jgi:hypothetical protein
VGPTLLWRPYFSPIPLDPPFLPDHSGTYHLTPLFSLVSPNHLDPFCFRYTNCLPLFSKWLPQDPKNSCLIVDNHQNKEDINNITTNISSINLSPYTLKEQCSHIKDHKGPKSTFEHFMGHFQNLSSYGKPSYHDEHDSSHNQGPHTTHFS